VGAKCRMARENPHPSPPPEYQRRGQRISAAGVTQPFLDRIFTMTQILELGDKQFVVIERKEFERLTGRPIDNGTPLPPLPKPDANGNYPAIAYGRTLLARRIVAARNRAGWSQAELARRSGVRKETIHRIEAAKNNPDESTYNKIEKAFKAVGVAV
jgi:DNA-binding XRE family transcriptional regulator